MPYYSPLHSPASHSASQLRRPRTGTSSTWKCRVSHQGTAERNDPWTFTTRTTPACLVLNIETKPAVSEGSSHFNQREAHGNIIRTTIFQANPMIIRDTIQLQLKVNKDLSLDTTCILSQPWKTRSWTYQRPSKSEVGSPHHTGTRSLRILERCALHLNFWRESIKIFSFLKYINKN